LALSRVAGCDGCPLRPTDLVISMGPEPVALYYSQRKGWLFPSYGWETLGYGQAWDYGYQDILILRDLKKQGGQWLLIPSWNAYTGASGQEFLRTQYPALYREIFESFDLVREIPEGLIFHAK
jgi:hypothetical protein